MGRAATWAAAVVLGLTLAGCDASTQQPPEAGGGVNAARARLDAIDEAVARWRQAETVDVALAAAEEARNLVVGPAGPMFGDADGDGSVDGDVDEGFLPGLQGEPGMAQADPVSACVEADVLGGSWDDPGARWDEALDAYEAWSPDDNTMPTLASHPQRVVGWATFTLDARDLDAAHEYASHAQLHVDISRAAFEDC